MDEATSGNVSVRGGRADEGPRLKDVAIAAKCHWGYPVDRVHEWADQGDFSPRGIEALEPFVVEADGRIVGWASVVAHGEVAWLEDLWVEPAWMRRGVGTTLFRHALERARVRGARRLEWEAEPNALGFYEKLGAARVRDSEPTAFGRVVAVMGVDVDA